MHGTAAALVRSHCHQHLRAGPVDRFGHPHAPAHAVPGRDVYARGVQKHLPGKPAPGRAVSGNARPAHDGHALRPQHLALWTASAVYLCQRHPQRRVPGSDRDNAAVPLLVLQRLFLEQLWHERLVCHPVGRDDLPANFVQHRPGRGARAAARCGPAQPARQILRLQIRARAAAQRADRHAGRGQIGRPRTDWAGGADHHSGLPDHHAGDGAVR